MSLFQELKRRNVFRVALAYGVVAWLAVQIADVMIDNIGAPDWLFQTILLVLAIGFPIALVLAWAFELTPEGIKREDEVDRTKSITPQTGRRLDRGIIILLALVVGWFLVDEFIVEPRQAAGPERAVEARDGSAPAIVSSYGDIAPPKTIAVLPFADLSQSQDQAWFADGLAEEILNTLARTPDLLVTSRTAAFAYRDSTTPLVEIADELGVDHILEGSVRRAGNRLRVSAQLIRAEDGFQLWSQTYDRDEQDVIALQEALAVAIATALETTMDPEALEAMLSAGTRNVEAYQAYLAGTALRGRAFVEADFKLSRDAYDAFEQARTLDPNFSAAHAEAASYWRFELTISRRGQSRIDLDLDEKMARFRERIGAAIETAPNAIDRQRHEMLLATAQFRVRDVIQLARNLLEARPYDTDVLEELYNAAAWASDREVMAEANEHALRMDELGVPLAAEYFVIHSWRIGGDSIDRETYISTTMALVRDKPSTGLAYQAHRGLLWLGETEKARSLLPLLANDEEGRALTDARQACAEGRRADAEAILAALPAQFEGEDLATRQWHLHMMLGQQDAAVAALKPYENIAAPLAVSAYLIYPQFDPAPFPVVMSMIERENIVRPPAVAPGFQCPPPKQTAIAVLPFVNMSADPDNEYFSDGVSEEILNVLAGVPDLSVASRTSAFRFKGSDLGAEEIAEELGVTHVLEGSVRKAGNQVRITAQLIKADDGFHLWSETYDRELDNIFVIQDEIAGNIAEVLQVELLGGGKPYTEVSDLSPDNYERFLKASFLMRQRNENALLQAVDLLETVLAETPDFPRGLAQLAEAMGSLDRFQDENGNAEIDALAERALALEPELAAAHMIVGNRDMERREMLSAIRRLERAIELDPSEPRPYHWLGIALASSGYLEQALEALETSVELQPDHANANGYLGLMHLLLEDYDAALYHFERQDTLGNNFGAGRRIQVMAMTGETEAARRLIAELEGLTAADADRLEPFLDAVEDPTQVDAYLAYIDENGGDFWHVLMELMILEQYERALVMEEGGYPRLFWGDRWAASRDLPEFDVLVTTHNLAETWDTLGPPPDCRKTPDGYDCGTRGP